MFMMIGRKRSAKASIMLHNKSEFLQYVIFLDCQLGRLFPNPFSADIVGNLGKTLMCAERNVD